MQTAASVYCHANVNLEKSLLVCYRLLIHLMQFFQSIKTNKMLLLHLQIQSNTCSEVSSGI